MDLLSLPPSSKAPLVVSAGIGVDSTAALVYLKRVGIRPDLVLFANTGAERPSTYAYVPVLNDWLGSVGFPAITEVAYEPQNFKNSPPYHTLEQNCLTNGTLPSITFGYKSCSQKWKISPQNRFCTSWTPALEAWDCGLKVTKLIGYDAGPQDAIHRNNHKGAADDPRYAFWYPLVDLGWDREACKREIAREGLPVPSKSACFFCLSTKPEELHTYPAPYLRRIVRMEARAKPRLHNVEGLWRTAVKGTRGGTPRPGSMTEYILQKELLPREEVERIVETTLVDIVSFQQGYAEAKASGAVEAFLAANRSRDYRDDDASLISPPSAITPAALELIEDDAPTSRKAARRTRVFTELDALLESIQAA